jgi:large subunit ribosomal protein L21
MARLAVIATGGKQYIVKEGDTLVIEKLLATEGSKVEFAPLLVSEEDGSSAKVGKPTVAGAMVTAKVAGHGRADKVMVVKFHAKTRYKRNNGHRQEFTSIAIEKIS